MQTLQVEQSAWEWQLEIVDRNIVSQSVEYKDVFQEHLQFAMLQSRKEMMGQCHTMQPLKVSGQNMNEHLVEIHGTKKLLSTM